MTIGLGMPRHKMDENLKYLWIFSLGFPFIGLIIGNANGSYGYSWEMPFGICYMNSLDENLWFVLLLPIPSLVLSFLSIIFMCLTVRAVFKVLVGTELVVEGRKSQDKSMKLDTEGNKIKKNWKKMLSYNQRSLMFIFIFCFCNSLANGFIINSLKVKYDDLKDDVIAYVACLLLEDIPSGLTTESEISAYPMTQCGQPDDAVDIWPRYYYASFWTAVLNKLNNHCYYFLHISFFLLITLAPRSSTTFRLWSKGENKGGFEENIECCEKKLKIYQNIHSGKISFLV